MYRIYIGNLHPNVTETILLNVFKEYGLHVSRILVKKGYGFIDCPDQATFDLVIDRLNGYNLMGIPMQVEPSTVSKRRRCNRVLIRNLSQSISKREVENLVVSFGRIDRCDLVVGSLETSVVVVYQNSDEANLAVEKLNNYECHGSVLRAEFLTGHVDGIRSNQSLTYESGGGDLAKSDVNHYVLRILIPADYVGVIIGHKGQVIKNITSQSGAAKVDVSAREQVGHLEKVITNSVPLFNVVIISGHPESVSKACSLILKTMQQRALQNNDREVVLRIITHDMCCGRIIGREGRAIHRIREQTSTRITISNPHEASVVHPDRVISVEGDVESLCRAEVLISRIIIDSTGQHIQRQQQQQQQSQQMGVSMGEMYPVMDTGSVPGPPLRHSQPLVPYLPHLPNHEIMMNYNQMPPSPPPPCPTMFNPLGLSSPVPHVLIPYPVYQSGISPSPNILLPAPLPPRLSADSSRYGGSETYYVYVPDCVVGAMIGIAGRNIRQMIRDSHAKIQVAQKTAEEEKEELVNNDPVNNTERCVTVRGSAEACRLAIQFIYERLNLEGFTSSDNTELRIGTPVPRPFVGRIIGKFGRNIQNLQHSTGAKVKILSDAEMNERWAGNRLGKNCDSEAGEMCKDRGTEERQGDPAECGGEGSQGGAAVKVDVQRKKSDQSNTGPREGYAILEACGTFGATQQVFAQIRCLLDTRR